MFLWSRKIMSSKLMAIIHDLFVFDEKILLSLTAKDQSKPFNVTIVSQYGRASAKKMFNLKLSGCNFGYLFWPSLKKCICDTQRNRGIAHCDGDKIHIFQNMWSNPNPRDKYDDELIVPCP